MNALRHLVGVTLVLALLPSMVLSEGEAGGLDRAVGHQGMYRLRTGGTQGKIIQLPRGMADLKQVEGGYNVFFSERTFSHAQIEEWATTFCDYLQKSASVTFYDGSGPRRRIAAFSCY